MTEALLVLCQPPLEEKTENWLIQEMIDFAIQRMQVAAMARRELLETMVQRIYTSVLDKMTEIVSQQMASINDDEAS